MIEMAVGKENDKLYALMNQPPAASSPQAAAQAAQVAAAEQAAQNIDYSRTADARLDRAINEYLSQSGFNYDVSRDKNYQEFAKEYSQNALSGRSAAQLTANQLSGGYTPTYADAVGSAVQSDIEANRANYTPAFRAAAQQEAAARAAQAGQSAQIYNSMADTDYARGRDTQGDRMSFLSYLANRYNTERQADVQRRGFAGDVYRSQLSGALQNATDARGIDNSRYQFDGQSAENRAKLAVDANEFNRKMEYTAAKDAYDDRIAAAQAAAAAEKEAAAAEKKANTAAKNLETQKKKYDKNAWKIQQILSGKRKLSGDMEYDLDYNKDGKVDNTDLSIAQQAAKTGQVQLPVTASDTANKFLSSLRGHYGNKMNSISQKTLESLVERYKLSDSDAAYVYHYFGL